MDPDARPLLDGARTSFQVGEALTKSMRVWASNLIPLLVVSVIASIPTILIDRRMIGMSEDDPAFLKWIGVGVGSSILMSSLATGVVTYAVVQQMRGRPTGLGEALSVGVSRLFPVIGVAILVGLLTGLGFVLLVVPGIIVWLMLTVAVPVAIIEKPGVWASLRRSAGLTKGVKGQLAVMFLLLIVVGGGVQWLVITALRTASPDTQWVVNSAIQVVFSSFGAVLPAVVYVLLRSVREGANIEDVARVFD